MYMLEYIITTNLHIHKLIVVPDYLFTERQNTHISDDDFLSFFFLNDPSYRSFIPKPLATGSPKRILDLCPILSGP